MNETVLFTSFASPTLFLTAASISHILESLMVFGKHPVAGHSGKRPVIPVTESEDKGLLGPQMS